MRHEELKAPRQQVRTKDYLLVVRFGRFTRKIVWNERSAYCLDHPEGWTIFKEDGFICIADNTDPDPKHRREKMISIPADEKNKVTVEIPAVYNGRRYKPMSLTLKPLSPIDPPYKQILYTSTTPLAPRQLLMYQGVRHFLLKYRPVGSRLTTRIRSEEHTSELQSH